MKIFVLFFFVLTFVSCSTVPKRPYLLQGDSLSQNYFFSYDSVWNAALKALSKYSIDYSNKDSGVIKTTFISDHSRSEFYYSGGIKLPKENKWKLELRLLSINNHTTRVKIEKEEYVNPGFLEEWKQTQSDLLSEKAILYRIGRIISLENELEKLDISR